MVELGLVEGEAGLRGAEEEPDEEDQGEEEGEEGREGEEELPQVVVEVEAVEPRCALFGCTVLW